jgi:cytochrome c5
VPKAKAGAAWVLLAFGIAAAQGPAPGSAGDGAPYRIECGTATALGTADVCRADVSTYVGWRVFHAQCASCHAADAQGSSFAPDLTRRMRGMDSRAFFAALDEGYLGPDDAMPPRGANPDVSRYYNELWSYLSARVSGDLPPGPIERLPNTGFAAPD